MRRIRSLTVHGLLLAGLLAAAVALATWRGGLLPFDLSFSASVAAGGLVILGLGWGPVWLAPLAASAALPRPWQRLLLWPLFVTGMLLLHDAFGPARGFAPLDRLGGASALGLYAGPVALALLFGSVGRDLLRPGDEPRSRRHSPPIEATGRSTSPIDHSE